jgi:hypothetical protein
MKNLTLMTQEMQPINDIDANQLHQLFNDEETSEILLFSNWDNDNFIKIEKIDKIFGKLILNVNDKKTLFKTFPNKKIIELIGNLHLDGLHIN